MRSRRGPVDPSPLAEGQRGPSETWRSSSSRTRRSTTARWANNGWLQELPKPITKLAWGNAAIMSPATAEQLGVGLGSYAHGGEHGGYYMPVVELQLDGGTCGPPRWIMPGHADRSVTRLPGPWPASVPGEIGGSVEQQPWASTPTCCARPTGPGLPPG